MSNVIPILEAIGRGDPRAPEELLPLVYDELRRLAAQKLAQETPGQTLQPTALVHEAYLRLVSTSETLPAASGQGQGHWNSRGHFFAAAAEAMRRILIERARRKQRLPHGGGRKRPDLDQLHDVAEAAPDEVLALDEALERLSQDEPVVGQVVKLRYFAGLSIEETAATLNVSVRTTNRHWAYARAWLYQELSHAVEPDG